MSYITTSVITGDDKRPDIVVMKDKTPDIVAMKGKTCMVHELTVDFETNILKNSKRKLNNCKDLVKRLKETYYVKYVDLGLKAIGVIGKDSKGLQDSFINMGMSTNESTYLIRRIVNVCTRTTYVIFCQRNKQTTAFWLYWASCLFVDDVSVGKETQTTR